MLRIGICDDEINARDSLRIQLEKILDENTEEIVYEFSSGTAAVRWLQKHPGEIDLLFLDVEMNGISGLEAAMQIRSFDQNLMIVFVTGYSDYVFDGYRVGALDYLMKPIKPEQLAALLARVRQLLFRQRDHVFSFKSPDGTYRIPLADITYFYSDKRKVVLVAGPKKFSFYEKLDHLEMQFEHRFIRIHQRYLINPDQVTLVTNSTVSLGEIQLPISRSLKDSAASRLAKAMLGGNY